MAVVAGKLAVWAFLAFWLWLLLATVLRELRLPLAHVTAAVLGWIAAGLLLTWALPSVVHTVRLWLGAVSGVALH